MKIIALVGCLLIAATAHAQTWTDVLALPASSEVVVDVEQGNDTKGLLRSVEDVQMTIMRGTNLVTIQKDNIRRIRGPKYRDAVWDGAVIGLVYAVVAHVAYGDDSFKGGLLAAHYGGSMAFWAGVDWLIKSRRTVYRTP
ncbi:MAG TPA: hypothetical protein VJM31_14860 [Vicinamibacterales bacterium]|nr:hypothetical protein [Vicinamibacterales bacterium]